MVRNQRSVPHSVVFPHSRGANAFVLGGGLSELPPIRRSVCGAVGVFRVGRRDGFAEFAVVSPYSQRTHTTPSRTQTRLIPLCVFVCGCVCVCVFVFVCVCVCVCERERERERERARERRERTEKERGPCRPLSQLNIDSPSLLPQPNLNSSAARRHDASV